MSLTRVVSGGTQELTERFHDFRLKDHPASGWSFPLGEDNLPLPDTHEVALNNYRQCLTGVVNGKPVLDKGISTYTRLYREPSVGECECGNELTLGIHSDVECVCGRWYNSWGQELNDPSLWEDDY